MPLLNAIAAGIGLLTALIQAAESIYGGKGMGKVKKENVVNSFLAAIVAGVGSGFLRGDFKDLAENADAMKPVIGSIVDGIVTIANTAGTFMEKDNLETLANQP